MRYNFVKTKLTCTHSAQYVSLDALSALISSEGFQSTTAAGQIKIIVPALVEIISFSSVPVASLESRFYISILRLMVGWHRKG
jgi:hypothetical protein